MKKVYIVREFTVCKREDSENLNINCNHYLAKMYNNGTFEVNNVKYTANEFNNVFTENIP